MPQTNESTSRKWHHFFNWIKSVSLQTIKKKKRNSNILCYEPGTKTESVSQPSRSLGCKLFNIWDINQKAMLLGTRWKKCCISKLEHHLGLVPFHQIREAPADIVSVENTCIPHEVNTGMFAFWKPLLALFTWGDLMWLLYKEQHRSLLLKPHMPPWYFDIWSVCFPRQTALMLSFRDFGLKALQTTSTWTHSVAWGEQDQME